MTDQSSKQTLHESISALVDDQASEMELHRILRACDEDDAVRDTWTRYQLTRAAMRGDLEAGEHVDLSAGIRSAIERESWADEALNTDVRDQTGKKGWLQTVGRFAIAASVAGVVVMTSQLALTPDNGREIADASLSPASVPSVAMPAGYGAPGLSARTVSSHPRMESNRETRFLPQVAMPQVSSSKASNTKNSNVQRQPSPEVQAHLLRVMEVHAAHAALSSGKGMLPYARVPVDNK